ncbi:MAG: hypothetical protein HYS44_00215 [Candidatus Niyogibacteria bacterium]|nr:hypothetical protein [Candidatus Niyogibacteria bacterium]
MRVFAYFVVLVIVASGAAWYWLMTPEETVPWEVAAPEETAPDGYEREGMPNEATSDAEERPFAEEIAADEAKEEQEEEVRYYAIKFLTPDGRTIFSSTNDYGEIDIRGNVFTWTDRDGVSHYFVPSSDGVHITISEVIEPFSPFAPPPPPPSLPPSPPPPRR